MEEFYSGNNFEYIKGVSYKKQCVTLMWWIVHHVIFAKKELKEYNVSVLVDINWKFWNYTFYKLYICVLNVRLTHTLDDMDFLHDS